VKYLYEQSWFISMVTLLNNHWSWWKRWVWGYSVSMEDFVRNPAEELRDNFPPFAFQNVKPFSVLLRMMYIPYKFELEDKYLVQIYQDCPGIDLANCRGTYKSHFPAGKKTFGFSEGGCRIIDLAVSEWITKYPNAGFMLQFLISMKWKVIPIPFISMGLRFSRSKYFQFGLGWAPQWKNYLGKYPGDTSINAALSGKFRIGDYKGELQWNPGSEVYGYWEGTV